MTADTLAGTGNDHRAVSRRRALIVVLSLAAVLYLVGVNSHWRFQRDSAVYMAAARSLIEGRGYTYNGEPLTRYAPGFPLIIAAVGEAAGLPERIDDSFLALNLAMSLLGLGCVVLTMLILRELAMPPPVVLWTVLFLAFSRTLYYYSTHIMTDVPYAFFALLTLWVGLKMVHASGAASWAWCVGCAVLLLWSSNIRPVGPLLVMAVLAGLWIRRKGRAGRWPGRLAKSAVLVAVPAGPLLLWSWWTHWVAPEASFHYTQHALEPKAIPYLLTSPFLKLPGHLEGISDALFGMDLGGIPGLLVLPFLISGLVVSLRRRERMLSIFVILNVAAIIACGYALRRRYLLPSVPIMMYWLVFGAVHLRNWLGQKSRFWTDRRLRRTGWACIVLLLLPNVIRIGKVVYQSRSDDFYEMVDGGRGAEYAAVNDWLRQHAPRDGRVLAYEASTIHYFTRLRTVDFRPPSGDEEAAFRWLVETIAAEDIRYIVVDMRKEETLPAVDRLQEKAPEALTAVLETKRVGLLRVDRKALAAVAAGPENAPAEWVAIPAATAASGHGS